MNIKKIGVVAAIAIMALTTLLIDSHAVLADSINMYAVVGQGDAVSGSAVVTGSPARYTTVGGTITVTTSTTSQTFTVKMCAGTSATVTSGTATISGSPLSCAAGASTTVTVSNTITGGTCTIAVTYVSTGLWTSTYSWSTSSGGVPYAGSHVIPTSTNHTIFDTNSFGGAGESITLGTSSNCASMDWTGSDNSGTTNPTFVINSGISCRLYGSVIFIANMNLTAGSTSSSLGFNASGTLTTNGLSIPFEIVSVAGTIQLGGDLVDINSNIGIYSTGGNFDCNGHSLTCTGTISMGSSSAISFHMSSVNVTCGTWTTATATSVALTTTSTSILTVTHAGTFGGGSLVYNGTVNFNGAGTYVVTGSNTFNNTGLVLLSSVAQTVQFTDGTTTTVTACSLSGSAGNIHTLTGTSTAGWNLAKSGGGTVTVSYCTISYSVASPANTWYYDSHSTYNGTSGWSPAATASITNSPSSLNFGTVMPSTTYYANGTVYSNPVTPGQCTFTITNTGALSCTVGLTGSNTSGGNVWTLVSTTPTGDQYKVIAVYNGENPSSGLILTTSNQTFNTIAAGGTLLWDFEEITGGTGSGKSGTFDASYTNTFTIMVTGS